MSARFHLFVFLFVLVYSLSIAQKLPHLKVSNDHRHILKEDNKPFFWLGDTAWELFHRLGREEAKMYLEDRASKGFTVIQAVILAEQNGLSSPNAYGHLPLIDNDPTRINEEYFEHVDFIIKEAEKLGMYIGLLPTWGDKFNKAWGQGPEIFTPVNAEEYGEILAKRYKKQSNIIWILGGDRWPEDDEDKEIIRGMAAGIRKVDREKLITYHPKGYAKASDHFNEKWLDLEMFQTGHDRRNFDFRFVRQARDINPKRPVINGEPRYEDIPDRFKPEEFGWLDDSDVRSSAYWTMLSGAAGYTYGAHSIWQMYDMDLHPVLQARRSWKSALDLPGSEDVYLMKQLLTSFPWQKMRNDQSLILNENPEDSSHIVVAIGDENDFILAYTPMGKAIKLDLSKMNSKELEAWWFNPRDGQSKKIGEFLNTESPIFDPWAKGRGSDFVLMIKEKGSVFTLPEL